ncbi:DNA cross-link repair protein PSO2/SNM1 [Cladophialophora chaetospira]|uniref:DNA cross-link repair protein PSO2/SNM1 n=1 Tax=Cladophialophora chaetospira TaxID=386627 RepID=A0AA38XLI5_9EURO|nr:DNA cross-link repair protein PSO2/SNM1 [Cladophialophora chaetospira]
MFRNPRENKSLPVDNRVLPDLGRPPTPPSPASRSSPYFSVPVQNAREQGRPVAMKNPPVARTPVLGRQIGPKTPASKKTGNQSILSFFNKAGTREEAEALATAAAPLFFKDVQHTGSTQNFDLDETRFNEDLSPVKKRRIDEDEGFKSAIRTPSPVPDNGKREDAEETLETLSSNQATRPQKYRAGFLDESSDEEDNAWTAAISSAVPNDQEEPDQVRQPEDSDTLDTIDPGAGPRTTTTATEQFKPGLRPRRVDTGNEDRHERTEIFAEDVPALRREATSVFDAGDFGDEDFENDEFFEGGEEFMERKWMEEQREMGMDFDDEDSKSETESVRTPQSYVEDDATLETTEDPGSVSLCPICNGSMGRLSETQASSHVNACLDGTAEPLPQKAEIDTVIRKPKPQDRNPPDGGSTTASSKRFKRAAIARPAQSNPFQRKDSKGGSAFARLMSGHAEDAAWAEAASNEAQSRGKPAYQRTCPFYKIMPGLYICVDAFRYGKVEGQNAYFLSHFHSDHYIGLTSSWSHGPIYASKVTCNLMIQQLRVDPKWVVPLEFEKKVEVPNTKGVFVTMIPANHCPGSSLYLFEKVTGKNRDGSSKQTRILHCGDFRACPAHVAHPLLRPDVVDAITGQARQQVIDTCYLDTTYLTPKYAFPSQQDVIDACAQMCVSLAKEIVDSNDNWEKTKAERAGSVMKRFLEQGEAEAVKPEEQEEADKKPKVRGRLLVVIGTYSIGKERICLGIAKALNSKIYAPPSKMRICKCLEDPELDALLTKNPLEAQVHMTPLMEIRAETLHDYLMGYNGHFARVVGFRPTGWSYRPPTSRFTENPAVNTVLHSEGWKTRYTMRDLAPQRGSTRESNCFGVPYSEHSSFRELTMFCCALRINRIVPTVNVGSARSREKMKGWIEKWEVEKRKKGLFQVEVGAEGWGSGDGQLRYGV